MRSYAHLIDLLHMLKRLANLVNGIVGVIIFLLTLRFILEIAGSEGTSTFAHIIFSASGRFHDPLLGLYDWFGLTDAGPILLTFLTIVIYAVIGWFIAGSLGSIAQSGGNTKKL